MIPLADVHCHLLAGIDDGPRTVDEAVEMCRIAFAEGTRVIAATAHQNDRWPDVTPELIRQETQQLNARLKEAGISLSVVPTAEITAFPDMVSAWEEKKLLSLADRRQYLLVELPRGLFVDLRETARQFRALGLRLILAHPERQPELLHEAGLIEELIEEGCLVQVSSGSLTNGGKGRDSRALKNWFQRGIVHLLGSDGHSPTKRPPRMAEAYHQVARWTDSTVADRICSTNGLAVLQGLPVRFARPEPVSRRRFWELW